MLQFEDSISKSTPAKRVSWYALLELAEQVVYQHTNGTLAGPGDSRTINELADMVREINGMEGRRSKYPPITRPATTESAGKL